MGISCKRKRMSVIFGISSLDTVLNSLLDSTNEIELLSPVEAFVSSWSVLTCVVILLIGVTYGYELFGKDQLKVFNPNYNSRVFRGVTVFDRRSQIPMVRDYCWAHLAAGEEGSDELLSLIHYP